MFSPDGRWLAYVSDESGTTEVYVRPFPGPGGRWQISNGGGAAPAWNRRNRMLLFKTPERRIMAVPYTLQGDSFVPQRPRVWCERQMPDTRLGQDFDLASDGKRVAMQILPLAAPEETAAVHVNFLLNFSDELRRRLRSGE